MKNAPLNKQSSIKKLETKKKTKEYKSVIPNINKIFKSFQASLAYPKKENQTTNNLTSSSLKKSEKSNVISEIKETPKIFEFNTSINIAKDKTEKRDKSEKTEKNYFKGIDI